MTAPNTTAPNNNQPRKIYSKIGWNEQLFFNRLRKILSNVETEIDKIKTGETFSPQQDLNMNGNQLTNVSVNENDESSAVNVEYVKSKLDNINDYRKVSVFDSERDLELQNEASTDVLLKPTILDIQSYSFENNRVKLQSEGFYVFDISTDVEGDYDNAYIELVVITTDESGVETETTVKKYHLNEALFTSYAKSFDGNEAVKLRVTNTTPSDPFKFRATLLVDKIY